MTTSVSTAQSRTPTTTATPGAPRVLAIVVTHRGREWLKDCLVSLAAQSYGALDVLVVDDASPDFRAAPHLKRMVKRHLRKRRWGFLRTPRPLGFGGAINWALSRVRTDADYLLFVHDDAALDRDAVESMVAMLNGDARTAIVGPKVVSWDDPRRLEEVGMAVDRFGYPYKGLELDEIDLGQHDAPAEVFFVTSTCMLVRHEVFKQLKGWDARMRAFAEDLDLCWRARIAGHTVRVEPTARIRHVIALATGRRRSPFGPSRYYIRRNRLRAVAKNASTLRLLVLIPQFILVTLAEMVGFIVLRQPREIANLARALGWNFLHFPQTLSARARAQRARSVPDRTLRRLTVRETTRVRSYISHQADRLEEAWGRRAEFVSERGMQVRSLSRRSRGVPATIAVAAIVLVLLGLRHFLWGPQAAVGELLPYPDNAAALWRVYVSPWQPVGLGEPGPGPPAYFMLGIFPILTLGAAGAAQKLLVATLGAAALWGGYRLTADLVDRPGRWVSGGVYALGICTYAALRDGALGALVFAAAAPFALHSLLRLTAWFRPARWSVAREATALAVAAAVSFAFVPGSLIVYVGALVLLAASRAVMASLGMAVRGIPSALGGLAAGWVLVLPWSAHWLSPGGPLERLLGDETWRTYAAGYRGHSMGSVLLGQTPDAPWAMGLALPLFGLIALVVATGQRRRVALALWLLVVASAWLVEATAAGALRPFLASPTEAGVLPALAFAGLAGIAVGAFRVDLVRRGVGAIHAVGVAGLAVAGGLALVGLVPSLWNGQWVPGHATDQIPRERVEQVLSLLEAEAQQHGAFRALWVGSGWHQGPTSALRPPTDHLVTGARGEVLSELVYRGERTSEERLHDATAAVEAGATDRGGALLGAFNVDFVVLERGPAARAWLRQRDLAVVRAESDYIVLDSQDALARAGVYTTLPSYVGAIGDGDAPAETEPVEAARAVATPESASTYVADGVSGPGVAFLAESSASRWDASIGDRALSAVESSWGNAWAIPGDAEGRLSLSYDRGIADYLWLLFTALAWIVAIGAVLSRDPIPSVPRRGPA